MNNHQALGIGYTSPEVGPQFENLCLLAALHRPNIIITLKCHDQKIRYA
jgi:hypothetical protein